MWLFIIGGVFLAYIAGLIYISVRTSRSVLMRKITKGRNKSALFLCLVAFLLLTLVLWILLNGTNALIIMIHLYCFWLICELVRFLVIKIRKQEPKRYLVPVVAMLLCAVYLTYGWISLHKVQRTDYELTSDKLTEELRIVHFADSHVGVTFGGEGLLKYVEEINKLNPDLVLITGDFVDDSTPAEELRSACDALGKLQTKYGVYFVWGNHDRGYYNEETRGWTAKELKERLIANGVQVLEDQVVWASDSVCVIGRLDRSDEQRGGRKSAAELLSGLDQSKYLIVLDHQPHDFDAEAAAGADLVLCGHTHGGQFIPILYVGEFTGEHDLRYGHEKRGNTDFIVTSGISNWALQFKTGCISEYVVIDIKPSH